jgi:peptidoglycan LD-endopeptidase LytH
LGFVCGLAFLAVLLWQTGMLRTNMAAAAPGGPLGSQGQAAEMPASGRSRISPAHVGAPLTAATNAAPHTPLDQPLLRSPLQSSLQPLVQRNLIIPVQGVHAEDLRDDFDEMRGGRRHEAIDIMAPRGTPVLAADDGKVAKLFLSKPGGLTVYEFDGSQTYCYYYAHLDRYAPGLKEGELLRRGEVLGYVGSTGNASPDAPHLHFAIFALGLDRRWWEGSPIDPYGFLGGSSGRQQGASARLR